MSVLRRKAGLSQTDLAEKLGVTSQAVSKWECGNAVPDIDILNAEADLMPNAGKAKTVDDIYKEYLKHQLDTGEIEKRPRFIIAMKQGLFFLL